MWSWSRWAEGARLSLCLAFRDAGDYHVRIAQVCSLVWHVCPEMSEVESSARRHHGEGAPSLSLRKIDLEVSLNQKSLLQSVTV